VSWFTPTSRKARSAKSIGPKHITILKPKVHKVEVVNNAEMQDNLQNSENVDSASVLVNATCNQIEGGGPPTESAKNENLQYKTFIPPPPPPTTHKVWKRERAGYYCLKIYRKVRRKEKVNRQRHTKSGIFCLKIYVRILKVLRIEKNLNMKAVDRK
jgi:hypothetical protein